MTYGAVDSLRQPTGLDDCLASCISMQIFRPRLFSYLIRDCLLFLGDFDDIGDFLLTFEE